MPRQPGQVRDSIVRFLRDHPKGAAVSEIIRGVEADLGESVSRSSVRSYLALNEGRIFERLDRGWYRMRRQSASPRRTVR